MAGNLFKAVFVFRRMGTLKRTRWRQWLKRGLVGVGALLVVGAAVMVRLLPAWPTYRAPESSRTAWLAARFGAGAIENGHAQAGLGLLDWAFSHGEHAPWLVTLAVTSLLRDPAATELTRWLDRGPSAQLSLEELDAELAAEGLAESPRYRSWRAGRAATATIGSGLGRASLESAGFRGEGLETLLARAKEAHSSALVLVKDGAVVGEWYFGGATHRTETMSATKPFAGLAIGFLLGDGAIGSVDAPLSTLLPRWAHAEGPRSRVTLRHVLTHTSGLKASPSVVDFIWRDDFFSAAADAEVISEPGAVMFYNNKAVNLLSGVVRRVSGKPLDAFLDERLFGPLGIEAWDWRRDFAGNPHAMSGLALHALDFAKVGVMLADGGVWQGRRVLPAAPSWGYLFALHSRTEERTLTEAELARMREAGVAEA